MPPEPEGIQPTAMTTISHGEWGVSVTHFPFLSAFKTCHSMSYNLISASLTSLQLGSKGGCESLNSFFFFYEYLLPVTISSIASVTGTPQKYCRFGSRPQAIK